jgi:hypothetical protein
VSGALSFIIVPSSVRVRTWLVVRFGSLVACRVGALIAEPSR